MTHECPNCGASVRDDGGTDSVRCRFCGTHVSIPRMRHGVTREALEAERDQLLAREREAAARITEAGKRGLEDFLVPPVGCCGIYFGLFVLGSLVLSAIGLKDSKPHGLMVAAIAIGSALAGVVAIIWWREGRRSKRVISLERERTADRDLREERLREIETQLSALDD